MVSYSEEIGSKPRIIVLNKIDLLDSKEELMKIAKSYEQLGCPVFLVSSLKREGLRELIRALTAQLTRIDGGQA